MDLNKMSVVELKALAYDIGAKYSQLGQQLQQVNQMIMQKIKEENEVKEQIKEVKKK